MIPSVIQDAIQRTLAADTLADQRTTAASAAKLEADTAVQQLNDAMRELGRLLVDHLEPST